MKRRDVLKGLGALGLGLFSRSAEAGTIPTPDRKPSSEPGDEQNPQPSQKSDREMFHDALFERFQNLKPSDEPFWLTRNEFFTLQHYVKEILRTQEANRSQMEKNLVFFYERYKAPYLYHYGVRQELDRLYQKGYFHPDFYKILERIRNRRDGAYDESRKAIIFPKINDHLCQALLDFAKQWDIHPKIYFSIALKENNFGLTTASNQGAMGILQIMPQTARYLEQRYNYSKSFTDFPKDSPERTWHLLKLGAHNIHRIKEDLVLDINYDKMEVIDFIALLIAYNKGVYGLTEELHKSLKRNGGEARTYVNIGLAGLQMNFVYQQ